MSKVKGIPRTFWQRYHSWFEGALVIAIVVAIVLFLAWGLNRIGDAARVERTRMSQNALYVCLDRSDGERALLLCLEQNGFTFTSSEMNCSSRSRS